MSNHSHSHSTPPSQPFTTNDDSANDANSANGADDADESTDPSHPERWLYAGESVVETEHVGSGWVTVTTHRLLVSTPDGDGSAFASYDRPAVGGVRFARRGNDSLTALLPRLLVYGLVFVGGWAAFRQAGLTALLNVDAGDSLAIVGMAGLFGTIRTAFELLEVALLVGGVLLLVVATALGAFALYSRTDALVVDIVGEGTVDFELPRSVSVDTVSLDTVRAALAGDTTAPPR